VAGACDGVEGVVVTVYLLVVWGLLLSYGRVATM